nr:MAG TPA: hypothetical protein [Caudoviricetes sp.]
MSSQINKALILGKRDTDVIVGKPLWTKEPHRLIIKQKVYPYLDTMLYIKFRVM